MHYENCCRKYFHVFDYILKMLFSYKIFTFSQHQNKFFLQKISKSQPNPNPLNKSQPNPNVTHHRNSNSTHDSKLRQSKATTTKTPLPHHHNNKKNQNHTEREIGGSKARSRRGEIERRGAISAVLRSTRPV